MWARQNIFEYRDKPNVNVARILAETKGNTPLPEVMISADGRAGREGREKWLQKR